MVSIHNRIPAPSNSSSKTINKVSYISLFVSPLSLSLSLSLSLCVCVCMCVCVCARTQACAPENQEWSI